MGNSLASAEIHVSGRFSRFCAIFDQIADWPKEMRALREKINEIEGSKAE